MVSNTEISLAAVRVVTLMCFKRFDTVKFNAFCLKTFGPTRLPYFQFTHTNKKVGIVTSESHGLVKDFWPF